MTRLNADFLLNNWKSTTQSVLTVTFALTGVLMVSHAINARTAEIMVSINSVCKVMLGVFQTDGVQLPPGSKIESNSVITTPKAEA